MSVGIISLLLFYVYKQIIWVNKYEVTKVLIALLVVGRHSSVLKSLALLC